MRALEDEQTSLKLKLGFIGCGKISEKHFAALEEHINKGTKFEVAAVCDVNEERSLAAANRMGAKSYVDIDEMLDQENLDIVTIATPNGLHPEHIKKVASRNIDVITDKPIAITLDQGRDLVAYCAAQRAKLYVVYQVRFNDTIQLVNRAIEEGRFGKIYLISSNVYWTRPQEYYDQTPWHGTKHMDGGAVLTQSSHYIDIIQYLMKSQPRMVFAKLKTLARRIETEDTASCIIEWVNGALSNINVTMLSYNKNFEGSITILGEKGTVKIGGGGLNKIEHWEFADQKDYDAEVMIGNYPTVSEFSFGHARYYENVFKSILQSETQVVSGAEGLKSLELMQAIYDSDRESKAIFL